MENKNENITNKLDDQRLDDQRLEDVAGGHFTHITVHTDNDSKYTSGDTPKYAVGQHVQIEADFSHTKIPCEVLSVSEEKTGGLIYKEFVYSVKILPFPGSFKPKLQSLIGKEYTEVYESCLFE